MTIEQHHCLTIDEAEEFFAMIHYDNEEQTLIKVVTQSLKVAQTKTYNI